MARFLHVALTSLVVFAALVFGFATVEGLLDNPSETRNLLAPAGRRGRLLALLSGAPTPINVAVALTGMLGAAAGAYLYRSTQI